MTDRRIEALMVRVADGLATAEEEEELMARIGDDDALQRELAAHRALKATTDAWIERIALDGAEDRHNARALVRVERTLGLALITAGVGTLGGYGVVMLALDAAVSAWVKLGVGALIAGGIVIAVATIRWRLAVRGSDRYEEVVR